MAKKYLNKYRSESARLQTWDYGWNGSYFITICTKNRIHFFGEIENGKMILNEIGKLAHQFWAEIPKHFPFVELGNFVIMPNHTHGVLIINKSVDEINNENDGMDAPAVGTMQCIVPTGPIIPPKSIGQSRFQNQGKNTISSIIGSFKSVTTKNARYINPHFGWQSRFHDHIIRNAGSFHRIQNYILNNPANWGKDKFHNNME